ncbi:MAG TPA: PDDEXK nuclease domain-containing protein [Prolixibacteraceae bacterium]|nr:PDDEXK nuclease domain-containing protein [Prolixibacteraceae bacterium]HPS14079.1 PDDEXK nuclease domain-containing protein [Prolixibacteraceae bacterium]
MSFPEVQNKSEALFSEVTKLIEESRRSVAITVNSALTVLYWKVGRLINNEILKNKRAEYGEQIILNLSNELSLTYGKGWGLKQIRHCLRIAETFRDEQIVYALSRQFTWTHIRMISYIDDSLKRQFYLEMCRVEKWSTRVLRDKIDSMLFERTAISKKPEETIENDLQKLHEENKLTPDLVFRDPYFLDFLGLKDSYSEKDLEKAILNELEKFVLEIGQGFSFVERQKRMVIDHEDYHLDLLFYHRKLRRLVAIDLKLGKFEASYKGQMELYLRYLEKYDKEEGEESPLGLILCSEKSPEQIELLRLEESGIKVAEYMTELPPKELLEMKLQNAINLAKSQIEMRSYNEYDHR